MSPVCGRGLIYQSISAAASAVLVVALVASLVIVLVIILILVLILILIVVLVRSVPPKFSVLRQCRVLRIP